MRALAALLLFGAAHAAAPSPPLLERLAQASARLTTLKGEFVQRNKMKLFKKALESRGRFAFEKPRRIRWEYLVPDPSLMILDGSVATLTMPGAAPQRFDLAADATMRTIFDQLLVLFGVGLDQQALADYTVAATADTLSLTPRPASPVAKAFTRIDLRVNGKTLLVDSILLIERNGDEKEITFSRLERK